MLWYAMVRVNSMKQPNKVLGERMNQNIGLDFIHPIYSSEINYIKSINYEISYGYFVIVHIFKEWEYIEISANCTRGGSSSINMNIDSGANKLLEIFTHMSNQINEYKRSTVCS
jgi:hypothetical protein